ncbi:hypothetical protein CDL15_Pgr000338 [Punica granatum]|uniref:Uncharacterized protein n=1 Tax=Punica granatum TaxID=22663 RepID=A0A218XTP9_PUNGR|nr:hypothetical protein CDL15_Pgr000338 [Punica granatum]
MRGKSRGSVRESGDSVERLKGCSGARACTFGELGERGRSGRDAGHTGGALEPASVRAGAFGRRACARAGVWRAGTRARGCERGRAATSVLFTREHVLHPKSPK